jgi:hypothetical protein
MKHSSYPIFEKVIEFHPGIRIILIMGANPGRSRGILRKEWR